MVSNPPGHGVFPRESWPARLVLTLTAAKGVFERLAGYCRHVGINLLAGDVRIRTGNALIDDAVVRVFRQRVF